MSARPALPPQRSAIGFVRQLPRTPLVFSATGRLPGKAAQVASPSPDTGQQGVCCARCAGLAIPPGACGDAGWGSCPVDLFMSFLNSVPRAPGVRSALAVACGLVLAAPFVAQATDADDVGQVVVTASRAPQPISRVLADVSVITRDEIERRGSASAVDLIAALPGFEISRTGGPASITGVFLRGAESRHLLVLIDGVRVDTQSGAGGATWEALPASQIERIEVVRGPASAVYGSDAMAGVVQIFTRQGQGPARVEVGFGVGTLGLWSSDAQVSGK